MTQDVQSRSPRKHVLIIGGGASGALFACHLLGDRTRNVTVTLIEKGREKNDRPQNCADPFCFVPRNIYGKYIADLLSAFLDKDNPSRSLRVMRGECVSISQQKSGVMITLADGSREHGDIAVIATGHDVSDLVVIYLGMRVNALSSRGTGFWHEACFMHGGMEAVYDDVPVFGQFAPMQSTRGPMFSARMRAKLAGEPRPAVVEEAELYGVASPR
jgi:hypothetical protein